MLQRKLFTNLLTALKLRPQSTTTIYVVLIILVLVAGDCYVI